jgi:prepilin-type N-terminal cleavage/methylation domain-containing protein
MKRGNRQSGFSLIEMIIVVALLLVVTAIVFGNINSVRLRASVQKGGVESLQDARGAMELAARDVRNAGFPNQKMYSAQTLAAMTGGTTYVNGSIYYMSKQVAFGIVSVTDNTLLLEGDVNGDGQVEQVAYRLQPDPAFNTPSGQCPCVLQRNVMAKTSGTTPGSNYATNWDNMAGGIVNSGASPMSLYGSTVDVAGHTKTLDSMFSAYKSTPVFKVSYDAGGMVSAVTINLDVIGQTPDPQNGMYPFATLSATARTYQPQ